MFCNFLLFFLIFSKKFKILILLISKSLKSCVCVCVYGGGGVFTKLCPTLVTPWTVIHQAPLSKGFPRQEYWSGLPLPSPKDVPTQSTIKIPYKLYRGQMKIRFKEKNGILKRHPLKTILAKSNLLNDSKLLEVQG